MRSLVTSASFAEMVVLYVFPLTPDTRDEEVICGIEFLGAGFVGVVETLIGDGVGAVSSKISMETPGVKLPGTAVPDLRYLTS